MKTFLLIWLSVFLGYWWGRAACAIRHKSNAEIDQTLRGYAEFQKQRDAQFPEMIGKWGNP